MDSKSKPIMDINDLSVECLSYLKIKQFLAERITEQQIDNDLLRQKLRYYMMKDIENKLLIEKLSSQLELFKRNDKSFCNLTSEEVLSINLDDEDEGKKTSNALEEQVDELREAVNKLTVDKFILFNELNELVMCLRRFNLDNMNKLLLQSNSYSRREMPIVLGIKFNVLSCESQMGQIAKGDQKGLGKTIKQEDVDLYLKLIDEAEREFDELLNKKFYRNKEGYQVTP